MKRRTTLFVGAAAAAGAAGVGVALWRSRPAAPALPADFWALRFERPEGGELALAALRGKPTLLNFWATWCAPCVKELPLLDRFQRDQATRWQVIALAIDSPTPVREFLRQRPLGLAVGLAGLTGVDLTRALGNTQGALPFTVVFDASGVPRERKLGAVDPDDLASWVRDIL